MTKKLRLQAPFRNSGCQRPEEMTESLDPGPGCDFRMIEIHLAAPDAHSDFGKAHDIVAHHISENSGHSDREAGPVGAVVFGGELMLDIVAVPVLRAASADSKNKIHAFFSAEIDSRSIHNTILY